MFKTLLASTALAGVLMVAANAQDAPAPAPIMPAPEAGAEAPAPVLPEPQAGAEDPADPLTAPTAEVVEETWAPVAIETVSADELDGADIRTTFDDARVATVGETIVGPEGMIEGVVAQFGGFLGFGRERVMLSAEEIEVFKDLDGRVLVRTDLTRDALEAMPEFEG